VIDFIVHASYRSSGPLCYPAIIFPTMKLITEFKTLAQRRHMDVWS